jgi:hypothetical protein
METLYLHRRQEMEKKIETLEESVKKAISEAEKEDKIHEGIGQFFTVASDLKDLLKEVAALVVAIEAGNSATGIEAATKLGAAHEKLLQDSSYLPVGPGKTKAARQNLDEALQALNALFLEMANERSRVSKALQVAGENQVSSRVTAGSRRGFRAILFQEMIKSVMISYFSDPSRDLPTLKLNLIGLQTWLSDEFPLREPYFRLRDLTDKTCSVFDSGANAGTPDHKISSCIHVYPNKMSQTIFARISRNGKRELKIPLYVIAPTKRSFSLPTYGLNASILADEPKTGSETDSKQPEGAFEPDSQQFGTFE